jgi:hydroxymethylglutaryl-CoA lyase
MKMLPSKVKIVEVGPRDGLQNEKEVVPTATKIELIERLASAGLRVIEATSFVSPKWVPQMGDNTAVLQGIRRHPDTVYAALTPNLQGFDGAIEAGATEVAIFAAASESFSRKNINCSISESLKRFEPIVSAASALEIRVRGYVSCVVGCPYEGDIASGQAASVARTLYDMGCYEVSLGDTIGVGNPASIARLIEACARKIPIEHLAGHYHDTYGMAIANIHASLQLGMATFDSSVAGLGGCPYAKGASGNVATEDVVYLLHGLGIETGIDLATLAHIGDWISRALNRPNGAKAGRALCANRIE